MKDILKHFVIGLVIGLIASGLMLWSYNVGKRHSTNTVEIITDTITDTITNWQSDTVYFNRYDTINTTDVLIINDTVNDTTYIQLPIYTYIYDTTIKDTNYTTSLRAVVEGFAVSLDTLSIHTEITRQETILMPKQRCWGVGAGLMYGTGGWGFGVGIFYKLF